MKKMYNKVKIDDNLKKLIADEIDRSIISPHVKDNPMVLLIKKNDSIYSKDDEKLMSVDLIKAALVSCLYFSDVVAEQIIRLSLNNNIIIGIPDILNTPFTQFRLAALEVVSEFTDGESLIELNPYNDIISKVKQYKTINLKT